MNLCKQNTGNRKEVKILICILKEILAGKVSRMSRKKKGENKEVFKEIKGLLNLNY